ncbi:MAG: hypothetical protein QM820_41320 [Minicystis sp.]
MRPGSSTLTARVLPRLGGLAVAAALGLSAAAAHAEPPAAKVTKPEKEAAPPDPSIFVDPSYDPAAHGGLQYTQYLQMSRGTARRSSGMMVTGIVIASVGAVGMASGTAVFATSGRCFGGDFPTSPEFGSSGQLCSHGGGRTSGMALLLAGTIAATMGVTLWVLGATHVPWAESSARDERARPQWARLVPGITPVLEARPGPTAGRGVELTWQF